MRVSKEQTASFIEIIGHYIHEANVKLLLHGSRVDDNSKGGDIDLLVISSKKQKESFQKAHASILNEIKKAIGDQKVDIVFSSKEESLSQPFLVNILEKAVVLKKW